MTTKELLRTRINEKKYSQEQLSELIGCSDRALKKYLRGITTYGRYLTKIMGVLDISVEEWNSCTNVKKGV